jgi:hypothetical protein
MIGWPGDSLRLPLSADGNALVVATGRGPSDVSRNQATALMREALLGPPMTGTTTQPVAAPTLTHYQVLTGTVTLEPGLGTAAGLARAPAWVFPFTLDAIRGCPNETTVDTVPVDASMLELVIVTGPDLAHVTIYDGAGTTACARRTAPEADKAVAP